MYVCRFQYVVRRLDSTASYLPTGLHLGFFRSWPSLYLPSNFFFGLPRALFCFGIHFNANLPSAILWTWPYHVSWFRSISFTTGSSNPICCLIVTFLILSFLDILEDLLFFYYLKMSFYFHFLFRVSSKQQRFVRLHLLSAEWLKDETMWDLMPCRWANGLRCFEVPSSLLQ